MQGRLNQWAHWARAQGSRIFFFPRPLSRIGLFLRGVREGEGATSKGRESPKVKVSRINTGHTDSLVWGRSNFPLCHVASQISLVLETFAVDESLAGGQ